MTIKAIETEYNGYKFRSRLEARWAVFFDAAGIEYQYELEGFKIEPCYGNSTGYLPDFYLPKFDVFVEVKGNDNELRKDIGKIMDAIDFFATPISEAGLILLGDIPYYDYRHSNKKLLPVFPYLSWHKGVVEGQCGFWYEFKSRSPHRLYHSPTDFKCGNPDLFDSSDYFFYEEASAKAQWFDTDKTVYMFDIRRTMKPYEAARQARFEHGETPVIRHD